MKASKGKSSTSKSSATAKASSTTTGTAGGSRTAAKGSNTKEAFLKKLKLCMANFDYKDETKDAKGKTDRL